MLATKAAAHYLPQERCQRLYQATIGNLVAGVGGTHPVGPGPISVVCALLLHLRLFAAFCYKADNFFYALSAINPVQEKLNRTG